MENGYSPVQMFLERYKDGDMIFCSYPRFGFVAGFADGEFAGEIAVVHFPGYVWGDDSDFVLSVASISYVEKESDDAFVVHVFGGAYGAVEPS